MNTLSEEIQPLGDNVIVSPIKEEQKTATGIYIPDTAQGRPIRGTVKAVGPGRTTAAGVFIPMTVQEGDTVLFGKRTGSEIVLEGETYLIMQEWDIVARIKSDAVLTNIAKEEE